MELQELIHTADTGGYRICQGDHGERAEREPKRGSGGSPQWGPEAEPLVGYQGRS